MSQRAYGGPIAAVVQHVSRRFDGTITTDDIVLDLSDLETIKSLLERAITVDETGRDVQRLQNILYKIDW